MSSDKLTVNTTTLVPATNAGAQPSQGAAPVTKPAVKAAEQKAAAQVRTAAPSVAEVAQRIESYLKDVNRALEFSVDAASGRTVVTVRDAESGDLIRQIPNEEVLRFAQLAEEQTVVLLSEKV
jgi:flagellar protein FlaG